MPLLERFQVKNVDKDGFVRPVEFLDNDAIRPTQVKDRTWTQATYFMFWFSATATTANWYAASTGMAVGLSMWEAVACNLGGQLLAGLLMALNGRAGAVFRIPFPVLCRSSFGIYGAYWPTFNRAVMAIVWNGVNLVQGAQCFYVMIHAISPRFENVPDTMGPKSALTSAQMICFFVFWLITCAFLFIPIPKMRILIYVKLAVFAGSAIAMLAWTLTLAGGLGPVAKLPSTIEGTEKSWTILKFFFLGLASCATFISNAADFQRYAKRPNDTIIGQAVGFPLSNFIVSLVGNIIAASSQRIFGELIWNPIMLLDKLMEGERRTAGNRAACFFLASAFSYSAIFSAIFENSIPAGNDIAALLPKYINIRRGFFICALLSFAICPWYLLSTAEVFINFLGSYQIFLSSITGILICDYFIIHRGDLNVPCLYVKAPSEPAHFFHGFNFRAFGAYLVAIVPNFYGFLNEMGVKAPVSVERFYSVAYPVGVLLSFGVYWIACLIFRPQKMEKLSEWKEPKDYIDENDSSNQDSSTIDGVEISYSVSGTTQKSPEVMTEKALS